MDLVDTLSNPFAYYQFYASPIFHPTMKSLTWEEEGVVCIPCWMLLRLEQRIEIPEWTFNEIICWHFCKT